MITSVSEESSHLDRVWGGVAEHRSECETRIARITAEVRCRGQRWLKDQEGLAAVQANLEACDELLTLIEEARLT